MREVPHWYPGAGARLRLKYPPHVEGEFVDVVWPNGYQGQCFWRVRGADGKVYILRAEDWEEMKPCPIPMSE